MSEILPPLNNVYRVNVAIHECLEAEVKYMLESSIAEPFLPAVITMFSSAKA